jgi:hypothetical protein
MQTISDKTPTTSVPAISDQTTNLSEKVFDNPHDFLKTIQDNYKEISHGHDEITLADLEQDSLYGSTAQIRAAATIASAHYADLDKISNDDRGEDGISKGDIDFANDMNDHKILGRAIENGLTAAAAVVAGTAVMAVAGSAAMEIAETATIAEPEFGLPIMGLIGAGMAIYGGYKAATAYSDLKKTSDEDAAKFKSWIS